MKSFIIMLGNEWGERFSIIVKAKSHAEAISRVEKCYAYVYSCKEV